MKKKLLLSLLSFSILFSFGGVSQAITYAAEDGYIENYQHRSNAQLSIVEPDVAPIVATIIRQAAKFAIKRLGKEAKEKVWPVVKKKLDDILEEAKDLRIKGPSEKGGERIFAILDGKKEIFRLDVRLLKKPDGFYLYVHYHIPPDLNEHHDIATIYVGKNRPPGFKD